MDESGTFSMENGLICKNEGKSNGGSVYVYDGTFTMNGGTISENLVTNGSGGGVFVFMSTFNMTGGTIGGTADEKNTAKQGGGVYMYNSTFNLSGKVDISGNTDSSGSSNVRLGTENDVITVQGKLENTQPIGVRAGTYKDITSGFKAKMPDAYPADFFNADEAHHGVLWDDTGTEVMIVKANKVTLYNNIASDPKTMYQYVLPKTETELRANPFTWKAHSFTAWNTQADGSGTEYADKEMVTLDDNQDLELYAQWELPDAVVTQAPAAKDLTYNGSVQELVTAGTATDGELQYVLGTDAATAPTTGYTTSIPTATDAGTYYVWYKAFGLEPQSDTDPECVTVQISKADPVYSAPTAIDLTYNGNFQDLVTEGSTQDGTMIYVREGDGDYLDDNAYSEAVPSFDKAGKYIVWFKVLGDENHNDSERFSVEAEIKKADSQSIAPVPNKLVYSGEGQALVSAGKTDWGTMMYAIGDENGPLEPYTEILPTAVDAKEYYVWYKVVGDENHNDSEPAFIKVTIADPQEDDSSEPDESSEPEDSSEPDESSEPEDSSVPVPETDPEPDSTPNGGNNDTPAANPATGAAAGIGILVFAAAAVVLIKKKEK
ncbi:MAG: hypothetical protein IKO27_04685 [Ruminococcus sp.]|nr:hypothetical protein [Ruminococcus sp.]